MHKAIPAVALTLLFHSTLVYSQSVSNRIVEGAVTGKIEVVQAPPVEVGQSVLLEVPAALVEGSVRTVERVKTVFLSDGSRHQTILSRYTELGGGLHYKDAAGKWQSSSSKAESLTDGSICFDKLPVKYRFGASANLRTVVTEDHSGGQARSAVSALSYYDLKSGKSIVFAWVKEAGVQEFDGIVAYQDAFKGVDADIVYKLHPWGMEQDIVLFGDLPRPSDLGLDEDTTRLCVLTELLDLNDFSIERPASVRPLDPSPEPLQIIGAKGIRLFNLQRCYAYCEEGKSLTLGGADRQSETLVAMRLFTVEGRTFLSEEVPVAPLLKSSGYLFTAKTDSQRLTLSVPPVRPEADSIAADKQLGPEKRSPAFSSLRRRASRYVIDYINYSGTQTNALTFRSNQTYFVSSSITFDRPSAILTVEPGCYVKFAPGTQVKFINGARMVSKCNAVNPALFTSAYDTNNAGEAISGYLGNPNTNRYTSALVFETGTNEIEGIHIKYAQKGIVFASTENASQSVRHSRFSNCDRAVDIQAGTNSVTLLNCLIRDSTEGFSAGTNRMLVVNSTFENLSRSAIGATGAVYSVYAANCLFVGVTNLAYSSNTQCSVVFSNNAFYNSSTAFLGSSPLSVTGNPFQVGTQGSNYLNQGVGLVNAGTAPADMLGLYHFTTATDHRKETNSTVDIGFHYASAQDSDSDGLADFIEDRNGNGIEDAGECKWQLGHYDTDGDGLGDGEEYWRYGTDPLLFDTDTDGSSDGSEVLNGANPLDPASYLASISGTIAYAGLQTGPVRLRACPSIGDENAALYLPFDPGRTNIAYDFGPFGNHAYVIGATQEVGRVGLGYRFNGSSHSMLVPRGTNFHLRDFTLAAWIKTPNAGSGRRRIVSQQGTGGYWILALNNNLLDFGICQLGVEEFVETRGVALNDNKWHFVAVVRDTANNKARWYVDGLEIGTRTIVGTGIIAVTNQDVFLGKVYVNTEYFAGSMDEVSVIRRAVPSNELFALYNRYSISNFVNETVISAPGAYALTNLLNHQSYSIRAWMDVDSNQVRTITEPGGGSNRFELISSRSGVNVTLTEPDTDGDGFSNFTELSVGSNPNDPASFPITISGTVGYSGGQTGPIRILVEQEVPTNNLLLYYNFESTNLSYVADASGNSRTSSINGATFVTNGLYGSGMYFDGNDWLSAGDILDVGTGCSTIMTISAWVKIPASYIVSNNQMFALSKNQENPPYTGWSVEMRSDNAVLCNMLPSADTPVGILSSSAVRDGNWRHVCAVFSAPTTSMVSRVYIDGNHEGSNLRNGTHSSIDTASPLCIGRRVPNGSAPFTGFMDEIRIYGRDLAASEIMVLRNSLGPQRIVREVVLSAPGSYVVSNLISRNSYRIWAYRDSNSNAQQESAEAGGIYTNNPISATNSVSGINISLTDPDADSDGLPDWWEIQYGLNPTSSIPSTGLVGWWKLDETNGITAYDATTNGNSGTLYNFSSAPWISGVFSNALGFDGTNDYVQLLYTPALMPTTITVSIWIKPDRTYSNQSATLFTKENSGSAGGYSLRYMNNGMMSFLICGFNYYYDLSCSTTLQAGTTYHLVGTYDGAYQRLYMNGRVVAETPRSISLYHTTTAPRMGASADYYPNSFFDGLIDDARVYNIGLPSDQVSSLYEPGADPDLDGLSNCQEYQLRTDPTNSDTDGDGITDYEEYQIGTNPTQYNPPPEIIITYPVNGCTLP